MVQAETASLSVPHLKSAHASLKSACRSAMMALNSVGEWLTLSLVTTANASVL